MRSSRSAGTIVFPSATSNKPRSQPVTVWPACFEQVHEMGADVAFMAGDKNFHG